MTRRAAWWTTRRAARALGAAAVVLLVLALAAAYVETRPPPGGQGLSDRIAAEVRRGEGTVVDLAALAPFRWTEMWLFPPYTNEETAEHAMGRPWRYRWSAVEVRDDRVFLVFLDGDRVVAAFDHPRHLGDLVTSGVVLPLRPFDAHFRVRVRGTVATGAPYHVLEPLPR